MIYKFDPIMKESKSNIVSLDGYVPKQNLLGPFRKDGRVVYYDPKEGKMLDPIINCYIREG
jgi:hypothetical protein